MLNFLNIAQSSISFLKKWNEINFIDIFINFLYFVNINNNNLKL
jgi:hypothetical protein